MTPGERQETPQERVGKGTRQALHNAFPPDQAANDVLGRLIEQIDGLNWPRSGEGETTQ
jgi:hypothetical protein